MSGSMTFVVLTSVAWMLMEFNVMTSSPALSGAAEQEMSVTEKAENTAQHYYWDWGTEFDIVLVMLLVYFAGARFGKVLKGHYETFQKLYEEEKLKLQGALPDGSNKLVDDDDDSTIAGGSDLSGYSSSDDEAACRPDGRDWGSLRSSSLSHRAQSKRVF